MCGRASHLGQRSIIGAGLGVLFGAPAFAGAVAPFPGGAEGGHAACRRRRFRGRASRGGFRYFFQVGVRARVFMWGVSITASESQRPDDLVCCVQRQRLGVCFAWGRRFRHYCVAVPNSRGWGADFPWLVHVLWVWRGVGRGARTPVPRVCIRLCMWALGAPPARSVAVLLRGASEAGRSPPSGCIPPGGCRGPLPTCCGHGCAGTGSSAVPVARIPCVPQGRAVGVRHPLLLWARVCGCEGPTLSPRLTCPVGAALRGAGWGRPRGGGLPPLRGASGVRLCPSPGRPPSVRAVRVRHPRAVGAGVWLWGPGTVPSACMPCGSCVPRG